MDDSTKVRQINCALLKAVVGAAAQGGASAPCALPTDSSQSEDELSCDGELFLPCHDILRSKQV